MKFRFNDGTSSDANFVVFDEDADSQEHVSEEQEVEEVEEKIHKRRVMAIEYGRAHKKIDWDEVTKQYITYVTPDEDAEGYMMAMDEDQEIQYETIP
jgi:hypothetical protein